MKTAFMHENRNQFLIFLRSMLEINISQDETSEFYRTGFLPVEWLDALFSRMLTHDQYHYVYDMMQKMYPQKRSQAHIAQRVSLYSLKEQRTQLLDDYENDLRENVMSEENVSAEDTATKQVIPEVVKKRATKKSPSKNHPWSKTLINKSQEPMSQKKRFTRLSEIVSEIFDAACKKSLHPSGSCVDFKVLQDNITHILPGHRIEVDNVSRLITLFDEEDAPIATHRIPEDFPCIRLQ